jgi:hypothetical protein
VSSQIALRWLTSVPVGCLHATAAFLQKKPLADSVLCDALAGPAECLQAALLEEGIPPEVFWLHVIPLAAELCSVRELAQVTLIKTIGRAEAARRVSRFGHLLTDLKDAFAAVLPQLSEEWTKGIELLRQHWDYQGAGLLGRIVQWIEPGILVDSATVVPVYPALRGGGAAHLPYNLVHIECQPTDPVAELPEVVRLGWLLSQLNLDLPRYSEGVPPSRLATVAALAMIPITLSAAAEVELARCDTEAMALAVQSWLASGNQADAWTDTLTQWWETYSVVRPAWATALQALDRLVVELGRISARMHS